MREHSCSCLPVVGGRRVQISLAPHPAWPPGPHPALHLPSSAPLEPRAAHAREIRSHTVQLKPSDSMAVPSPLALNPATTTNTLTPHPPPRSTNDGNTLPGDAAAPPRPSSNATGKPHPAIQDPFAAAAAQGAGGPASHALRPPFSPAVAATRGSALGLLLRDAEGTTVDANAAAAAGLGGLTASGSMCGGGEGAAAAVAAMVAGGGCALEPSCGSLEALNG